MAITEHYPELYINKRERLSTVDGELSIGQYYNYLEGYNRFVDETSKK